MGGKCDIRALNNPVIEEDPDNLRFKDDVANWLGIEIETVTNRDFPNASAVEVWEKAQYMSGPQGAPCTKFLKRVARQQWEEINKPDWHVLGFTVEEKKRHDNFVLTERSNLLPILIDARYTKQRCMDILLSNGIMPPSIYLEGLPNANCIGCVKAASATYWNHIRRIRPDVFAARAEQSRRIGAKLVKHRGRRMYLDELNPLARGKPMSSMNFECGIFCEEKLDFI